MPKQLNNIHDKFVKDMLSDRELATAFLEEMLPESVVSLINFNTLSYSDKSYLTPELDEIFSDMLLDIELKSGNKISIAILLEHKSYIDRNVPIQILRYLAEGYNKQSVAKEPLRPIIPLLYYHGKSKWAFDQFESAFEAFPQNLNRYLPIYESVFVSLVEMEEDSLKKLRNSMLHAALEVQRYDHNPKAITKRLQHIAENLSPYLNTGFAIKILIYLLQTTEVNLEDFKESLPEPTIKKIMSTYDMIMAEGVEKGIEKGIEKNVIKSVLNAFDNNFDLPTIQLFTGESMEKIMQILKENKRTK